MQFSTHEPASRSFVNELRNHNPQERRTGAECGRAPPGPDYRTLITPPIALGMFCPPDARQRGIPPGETPDNLYQCTEIYVWVKQLQFTVVGQFARMS